MAVSLKPLDQQVIVITGATSGIGLATARSAADAGAAVVLVARSDETLERVVDGIVADGGRAISVTADVGDAQSVRRVADKAIDAFGRIDTWVNNAGVDIFGKIEQISDEDSRRLFETNFWGTVYGSKVAVEHLRRRGGALINVGSVASDRAFPLQGVYSASKHAVKGFTDAFRMELEYDSVPISLTLIKPAAIGTPLPSHSKNYFDREPRLPSPLYSPQEVANAILYAAENPCRDLHVGSVSRIFSLLGFIAPRFSDLLAKATQFDASKRNTPAKMRADNLHRAGLDGGMVSSDAENRTMRPSFYTRGVMHPLKSAALLGVGYMMLSNFLARPVRKSRTRITAPR
jgi:NAD(P)-dependent dehydrogenase (short-subunit alcohol dehydrogenase family)